MWSGQCSSCGVWDSIEKVSAAASTKAAAAAAETVLRPTPIGELAIEEGFARIRTSIADLDRCWLSDWLCSPQSLAV